MSNLSRDCRYQWRSPSEPDYELTFIVRSDELKVTIAVHRDVSQDVVVHWVALEAAEVLVRDLQGTGYRDPQDTHEPHHRRGLSTLVFNTSIQVLHSLYAQPYRIDVSGTISDVDDQRHPSEIREELAQRRRRFWQRFGFETRSVDGRARLLATLDQLHVVSVRCMLGTSIVPLTDFRVAR